MKRESFSPNYCRCATMLGLLAEEYDPISKRQLGNFPQAFSHLALINTARNLLGAGGPVHQRSAGSSMTRKTEN